MGILAMIALLCLSSPLATFALVVPTQSPENPGQDAAAAAGANNPTEAPDSLSVCTSTCSAQCLLTHPLDCQLIGDNVPVLCGDAQDACKQSCEIFCKCQFDCGCRVANSCDDPCSMRCAKPEGPGEEATAKPTDGDRLGEGKGKTDSIPVKYMKGDVVMPTKETLA